MKTISLFGKDIPVRDKECSVDGRPTKEIKNPYVNIYVKPTTLCQANCKFCEYHDREKSSFDIYKFFYILNYLNRQDIRINKISFTGGEPTLYGDLLNHIVSVIREFDDEVPLVLNTNGYNLKSINLDEFDNIALSRHHYLDAKNIEIFGTLNVPSFEDIKNFKFKDKLHLRCNLIKGYIDSQKEALDFITAFAGIGVNDFGFVSLFQINDYCKENFVDHSAIDLFHAPRTMVSYSQRREGVCSCKNYLHYTEKGELVKIYSRFNEDMTICDGTLVYEKDVLTAGFNGEVIL